jgi:hypothetical protein
MKALGLWTAVVLSLCGSAGPAYSAAVECPVRLPAGITLRVTPDEKITAGVTAGPTIFTVSSDVRFFPNRPPLLSRGSKVLATIVDSKEAGHLWGKAYTRIALTSILTSDFCEYPIDARIVDAGRLKLGDNLIRGRGHAKRDVVALLFPPTTVYQILRLPSRGPKLVIDVETPLIIKLLQPVSLSSAVSSPSEYQPAGFRAQTEEPKQEVTPIRVSTVPLPAVLERAEPVRGIGASCPPSEFHSTLPLVTGKNVVVRPVRNLTPYHVSLYLNRNPIALLPPCYGPSMISTPASDFTLKATAQLLTATGQQLIEVKVVPNRGADGWDVVPADEMPEAIRAN